MLRLAHRNVVRSFAVLAAAVVTGAGALTLAPTTAYADSTYSMESQFIAKMNAARESNGQRPYSVASDLTAVARAHSDEMARRQELYHNPNLTTDIHNWRAVGENVGYGPTVSDIHTAFMNSPEHRDNILDHDFTQVGVGVTVDSSGRIWVTEDFREPTSTSSTSSSHPASSHPGSSHPAAGRTTSTARPSTARPVTTSTRPATPKAAPARTARPASRPSAAATPTQLLLARLTALRTAAANSPSTDPVAAAFDYLDNVASLTNG